MRDHKFLHLVEKALEGEEVSLAELLHSCGLSAQHVIGVVADLPPEERDAATALIAGLGTHPDPARSPSASTGRSSSQRDSNDSRRTFQGQCIRGEVESGYIIVRFINRSVLDEANTQSLGEELAATVESIENPNLLISLELVDHMSSAALGTLITIHNQVRAKRGRMILVNVPPAIREIFVITRLNRIFNIVDGDSEIGMYTTEAEAIRAIRRGEI